MKAFPQTRISINGNKDITTADLGMDLRDYFAAKAMQGLLSNADIVKTHMEIATITDVTPSDILCKDSYKLADAMMQAREQHTYDENDGEE